MPVDVAPHSRQLVLQVVDHALELVQLPAEAGLGLCKLALQGPFLQEEEEEEEHGSSMNRMFPPPLRAGGCWTHQADLGLQLDLERLAGSPQLVDLRSGGLKILGARRQLLVQVVELEADRGETLLLRSRDRAA